MRQWWSDILKTRIGSTLSERSIFQYQLPFDPSDFVHFRHRIGKEGMEKIFKQSMDLFGTDRIRKEVKEVRVNTTVQEKNITYPTDLKQYERMIEYYKRLAKAEEIKLKRTYTREIKKLKYHLRFAPSQRTLRNSCGYRKNSTDYN